MFFRDTCQGCSLSTSSEAVGGHGIMRKDELLSHQAIENYMIFLNMTNCLCIV